MKLENLIYQIKNKDSFLCIGLDTDINKIPKYLLNEDDPIFSFNKSIIDQINTLSHIKLILHFTSPWGLRVGCQ